METYFSLRKHKMSEITFDTPILLLHGLGGRPFTLTPLELALRYFGYKTIHRPWYPADQFEDIEKGLKKLDDILRNIGLKKEEPMVVIGASMGGVYANRLHERGWKILLGIYIGSPLNGAKLLSQLEQILPQCIQNALMKPPYQHLKKQSASPTPPHPYRTITSGWAWSSFDGCVYSSDAVIDPEFNTHMAWMDHRTGFLNPRLWWTIAKLIQAQ